VLTLHDDGAITCSDVPRSTDGLAIAQVTPFAWEVDNEVNQYVARVSAQLAQRGHRVLIVDCDPQANLSEAFGWTEDLPGERLEDLLANPDAVAGR